MGAASQNFQSDVLNRQTAGDRGTPRVDTHATSSHRQSPESDHEAHIGHGYAASDE